MKNTSLDMQGRELLQRTWEAGSTKIDLSLTGLPQGLLLVEVYDETGLHFSRKFSHIK